MAFFGAPMCHDDDPANAVRCALALQERMKGVTFAKFPGLRLHMGIGINTGTVIAGNIGSERRADYTVIGDEVNIAQRFESNAGPGQILITGATYELVKKWVDVRELGVLRVSGKQEGVAAFDVLRWREGEG
jgi:class 3 adenylate cyclase